jgi:putative chitinase
MIEIATLIALGIGPTQARQFAGPLSPSCTLYGIDTPARQAAFIAQCAHESQMFVHLDENLYYSSPERIQAVFPSHVKSVDDAAHLAKNPQALANRVYANRMGNGDEASGDGWRFRGAGLLMLTGRENHEACALAVKQPIDSIGDWMRQPYGACLSAAWFWASKPKLNALADTGDIDAVSRIVNGGSIGLAERRELFRICLAAFTGASRMASA